MDLVGYKYRIYPNKSQKEYFAKCFGCVRFFYNKSLSDMIEYHKTHKDFKNITPAAYKNEFPFLKEVDSFALCNAQLNRNSAFKNFFRGQNKFPNYKSKKNNQSYTTNMINNNIKLSDNNRYISIPKCKRIRIKKHRNFSGTIKNATISKATDDKYYISLLVETEIKPLNKTNKAIGLDLGVKDLIITSNGLKYKNHKYLAKSEKKLAREQRKLSHMVKGSSNRNKQRIKVARIHKHINNQRNDYLHKLSKHIIDENQIICVEDLKVMNMTKDNDYNKSLLDSSMSRLLTMLTYKANWYGRTIVKIPSDYPSSQLCSSCGYKNSITKNLSVRTWTCPYCQSKHDRDINAAKNILRKGIEILSKDGTHPDSLFTLGPLGNSSKKPPTSISSGSMSLGFNDIQKALDYLFFELKNPIAASNLLNAINDKIQQIYMFPNSGEATDNELIKRNDLRKVAVNNYYLFYLYDSEKDVIVIMRFIHMTRDISEIIKNL